jgi:hypothetical protein
MGTISDCNFAILNHNLSLNVKGFRDEYLSAGGIMGKLEKFSMSAPNRHIFFTQLAPGICNSSYNLRCTYPVQHVS